MTSELKSMLGENYADQTPIPQINYTIIHKTLLN